MKINNPALEFASELKNSPKIILTLKNVTTEELNSLWLKVQKTGKIKIELDDLFKNGKIMCYHLERNNNEKEAN